MPERVDKICSCGARLRFEETSNLRLAPINVDTGRNHFRECPDRKRYRRAPDDVEPLSTEDCIIFGLLGWAAFCVGLYLQGIRPI